MYTPVDPCNQGWASSCLAYGKSLAKSCSIGLLADRIVTLDAAWLASKLDPHCVDSTLGFVSDTARNLTLKCTSVVNRLLGVGSDTGVTCSTDFSWQSMVSAPIAEELVFRWGLQGKVIQPVVNSTLGYCGVPETTKRILSVGCSILLSSALFASVHHASGELGIAPAWIQRFAWGVAWGGLYEGSGSLLPSIVVHSLHNAVAIGEVCLTS